MSVEAGPMIYEPESPVSDEQHETRLWELGRAILDYCKDTKSSDMEKGSMVGKLFLRLAEDKPHRRKSISQFRQLCEIADNKERGRKTAPLFAGFLGELATADLFDQLAEIENVEYSTLAQDRFKSTDWIAHTIDGKEIIIQSKTISYAKERSEANDPVPVLSRVKTLDDLNNFIANLGSVCATQIAIIWDRKGQSSVRTSQMTPEMLADADNIHFSAVPDEAHLVIHDDGGGLQNLNSIEKICVSATHLCVENQSNDFIPVMCLLGSVNSSGSDVNSSLGTPSPSALQSARQEIKEILT